MTSGRHQKLGLLLGVLGDSSALHDARLQIYFHTFMQIGHFNRAFYVINTNRTPFLLNVDSVIAELWSAATT